MSNINDLRCILVKRYDAKTITFRQFLNDIPYRYDIKDGSEPIVVFTEGFIRSKNNVEIFRIDLKYLSHSDSNITESKGMFVHLFIQSLDSINVTSSHLVYNTEISIEDYENKYSKGLKNLYVIIDKHRYKSE